MLNKDYFRGHPIWKPLELELHRRRNNLNNQQLAQVVHAFGATGNATKFFFDELESTVIESPIPIETPSLKKILQGYALVDQGSPVFYAHVMEVLENRGFDTIQSVELAEICRDLKRATNLPQGAKFFHAAEKFLKTEMHQGRLAGKGHASDLCKVAELIFSSNVGSNSFQLEVENFLLKQMQDVTGNLQNLSNLVKSLVDYRIKQAQFEQAVFTVIDERTDELSIS